MEESNQGICDDPVQLEMTPGNTQPEEKTVEKTVFGVAEFAKEGEELQLKRLETDQSLPTEDLVQLMATE